MASHLLCGTSTGVPVGAPETGPGVAVWKGGRVLGVESLMAPPEGVEVAGAQPARPAVDTAKAHVMRAAVIMRLCMATSWRGGPDARRATCETPENAPQWYTGPDGEEG
ncbi:hypothetical protein GCM10009806_13270 [Microbacterium flavum]